MRTTRAVLNVASLNDFGFGPRTLTWWAVVGFMLIEGMGFVLAIGAYYFLLPDEGVWPPTAPVPPLMWSTIVTVLALLSEIPNVIAGRAAKRLDLRGVRIGLVGAIVAGLLMLVARWFEFDAMNVLWQRSAYGSIVWALLALHTVHMLTDVYDSVVLAAIAFNPKHWDGRKFSDASDNAMYWHFIVGSWIVLYLVIYGTPRWL
ncbi:cytochrome c oxidase subunit 3 [Cognatilysobacter terrigena]|uniref:cytochrome c oxidase subunit 3 n=1 Tax=Cognatilysobacter terrigena TaxID=2488749 RepID=UPI00105D7FF2|nr:cytochrome c oxidase subunit 3 [Lysobacter terrigena]